MFEQSLGVLLKFALAHVEALQIIDQPELFQHAKEILSDAIKQESVRELFSRVALIAVFCQKPAGVDSDKMQETLILHYLSYMAVNLEEVRCCCIAPAGSLASSTVFSWMRTKSWI